MTGQKYTAAHLDWLKAHRDEGTIELVTKLFNDQFSTEFTPTAIAQTCARYKIKPTVNFTPFQKGMSPWNKGKKFTNYQPNKGNFKKGNTPWNKGKKLPNYKRNKGNFKKGCRPASYRPIGSERIDKDGYIVIKTAAPNVWRFKHHVLYEQAHGAIPRGMAVAFVDGNNRNFADENLETVSKAEILLRNRYQHSTSPPELKPVIRMIAKVQAQIFRHQKPS